MVHNVREIRSPDSILHSFSIFQSLLSLEKGLKNPNMGTNLSEGVYRHEFQAKNQVTKNGFKKSKFWLEKIGLKFRDKRRETA